MVWGWLVCQSGSVPNTKGCVRTCIGSLLEEDVKNRLTFAFRCMKVHTLPEFLSFSPLISHDCWLLGSLKVRFLGILDNTGSCWWLLVVCIKVLSYCLWFWFWKRKSRGIRLLLYESRTRSVVLNHIDYFGKNALASWLQSSRPIRAPWRATRHEDMLAVLTLCKVLFVELSNCFSVLNSNDPSFKMIPSASQSRYSRRGRALQCLTVDGDVSTICRLSCRSSVHQFFFLMSSRCIFLNWVQQYTSNSPPTLTTHLISLPATFPPSLTFYSFLATYPWEIYKVSWTLHWSSFRCTETIRMPKERSKRSMWNKHISITRSSLIVPHGWPPYECWMTSVGADPYDATHQKLTDT